MIVIGSAPYRISLFGGGTDYPAWYKQNGGFVINTALGKMCHTIVARGNGLASDAVAVRILRANGGCYPQYDALKHTGDRRGFADPIVREAIKRFELKDVEFYTIPEMPIGAGLGGSSAYTVSLLAALSNDGFDKMELARTAIRFEREYAGFEVGDQDQYAAALGGTNVMEWDGDDVTVKRVEATWLEEMLYIMFVGKLRNGRELAKKYIESNNSGKYLRKTYRIAKEANDAIRGENREWVGELMRESWRLKSEFDEGISNKEIDKMVSMANWCGALGARLMGAGGGGYLLVYCKPDAVQEMAAEGMKLSRVTVNRTGAVRTVIG